VYQVLKKCGGNMIYLLAGTAKSGKTYVANKLTKEKGISFFSTDYLMVSLSRSNQNLNVDMHADDMVVAKQLEPFLEPMIEAMVQNNINYGIEGVHLMPGFVRKLVDRYPNKIRCCFLGYVDIPAEQKMNELIEHKKRMENCWYNHYTQEEMIVLAKYLQKYSLSIKDMCKEHQLPYFDIHNIVEDASQIVGVLGIK
jgi:2-phosphoglycerate kinase